MRENAATVLETHIIGGYFSSQVGYLKSRPSIPAEIQQKTGPAGIQSWE
jgi:hypothetical protein